MRLERAYFDRLYEAEVDPWDFATSPYEQAKYDHTLASIGRDGGRVGSVLEVGCSIGVLTARLADRADRVDALDVSPAAVARARARTSDRPGVGVAVGAMPEDLPPGPYDLVVCSEVLYYLDETALTEALAALAGRLASAGSLLAVHWRGETSYPLAGDAVHDRLAAALPGRRAGGGTIVHALDDRRPEYRLDRYDVRDA